MASVDLSNLFPEHDCYITPAKKLSDRGRLSGGVLCMIHKSLARYFTVLRCSYDNTIVFRVQKELFGTENDVMLFNVYLPPSGSTYYDTVDENNGVEILSKCILEMTEIYDDCSVLLCGDINARTGTINTTVDNNLFDMRSCVLDNTRSSADETINDFGKSLLDLCVAFNLTILNGCVDSRNSCNYTYVSPIGCSVIDYCIATDDLVSLCSSFKIGEYALSAHMYLLLSFMSLYCVESGHKQTPSATYKIIWEPSQIDEYLANAQQKLTIIAENYDLNTNSFDVNSATRDISMCLIEAADPMRKRVWQSTRAFHSKWYDTDCKDAKRGANRLLGRFLRSRNPKDRDAYVKERNFYKGLIRSKKNKFKLSFTENIYTHINDPSVFWKQIRSLNCRFKPPPNIDPTTWVHYFQEVYSSLVTVNTTEIVYHTQIYSPDDDLLNSPITTAEISAAIRQLRTRTAPGMDGILAEMLKCLEPMLLPLLLKLFNEIFNQASFPKLWCDSLIVPIHKKGPLNVPDNYRGISLCSALSKVFLHVLNVRLQAWADENDLIGEEQAGCRKGYSTIDNVFILHSLVTKYLQRKKKVYAIFVDFRKAFDTVNREALWTVLEACGINGKMGHMLKAVYNTVRCSVRCSGGTSSFFDCFRGLKQGCKMSPLLFSYLISYLSEQVIKMGKHGLQIEPNGAEIFMLVFVDDIVLLSDTVPGLQNQIDNLKRASDKLGLEINTSKTKALIFRNGGRIAAHEKWSVGNERLEVVSEYKYLGIVLSTKLCVNTILCDISRRAKAACIHISKSLRKLTVVTPDLFCKIFDAQIQPILLYGAEVWGLNNCKQVETVHLFSMKWFLGVSVRSPNAMVYGDMGRYPLHINTKLRAVKYWLKLLRMDSNRYPYMVYKMMFNLHERYPNWATCIKNLLFKYGFVTEWERQAVHNERAFIRNIKEKMVNDFDSDWSLTLEKSNRYTLYRQLKSALYREPYLYALDKKVFRDIFVRFRFGMSELYIHRYRYQHQCNLTICPSCMEEEEDELHMLFFCPALCAIREKYLMPYPHHDANEVFKEMLSSTDYATIRKVSIYLYHAFKRRSEAIEILNANETFFED